MSREPRSLRIRRRTVGIVGVLLLAVVLVVAAPVWIPLAAVCDAAMRRRRLPLLRLGAFAVLWAGLELAGVAAAGALWLAGQRRNNAAHYALQRWWAGRVLAALRVTCGLRVRFDGLECLRPGPVLLLAKHASLADSIVSAAVVAVDAGMRPRFVLKRELLADPCLDIVGQRIPNYFVDRHAADSAGELEALELLTHDLGTNDCGVIFPEGTRGNAARRVAALERIAVNDAARAERLRELRHLMPPRPAGARSMATGAPHADIVLAWHVGLDGLDRLPGIIAAIARGPLNVRYVMRRVRRCELDSTSDFTMWLDGQWLQMDREIATACNDSSVAALKGANNE